MIGRHLRPWALLGYVIGLLAFLPASSLGQATRTYEESVRQAVAEYAAGNFEEAQALFRQAHSLDPNARTWRGLGICAFELRLYVEATTELQAALADSKRPLTTEQRAETQQLLEKARGFVSRYLLHVTPADARVEIDGKPATREGESLVVDPGTHVLVTRAPGYVEQRRELRSGAGIREELSIELLRSNAHENESGVAEPPSPAQELRIKRRFIWTWSLAATAVAVGAVAVGLRVRVNALHNEFFDCRTHGGSCDAVENKGKHLQLGSRISGALAGGLALGAVTAFVLERSREQPAKKVALLFGPQSVGLHCTF